MADSTAPDARSLVPGGGLRALDQLRRPDDETAGTGSRYRAIVVDPNELRLQRMLTPERFIFGVQTPFVGRREALEQLYNAVRDATTERRLRVVEVIGGRGVGKTRLVAEMFAILNPLERGIDVLAVACPAAEDEVGTSLVAQLVRRRFGIQPADREAVAREKILTGVEPLVDARSLGAAARMLGFLAGLRVSGPSGDATPADMEQFRRSAERVFVNLMRRETERAGQVIVVHRAERLGANGVVVLQQLVEALADTPMVMMLIGDAPVPVALTAAAPEHVAIAVGALGDRAVERLVRAILASVDGLPDALVDDVMARSGGNPRLVEENVRLLIQRRVIVPGDGPWRFDPDRMPPRDALASSVEAAALARVAALADGARRLLEVASVFGYSFWIDGLVTLRRAETGQALVASAPFVRDELEDAITAELGALIVQGLLTTREPSTLDGQHEYAFAHQADRNRLYDELDGAERARLHRLAAQWLSRACVNEPGAWHEVIGNHWEEGGRPGDAADALMSAADAARDGYAIARAKQLYRRSLALIDTDRADILVRCLRGYGDLAYQTGDFQLARTVYGAMLEASLLARDERAGGDAWLKLGRAHRSLGDYVLARPCLQHAGELFRRTRDAAGAAATLDQLAKVEWIEGGEGAYDAALAHFTEALEVRRRAGDPKAIAESLGNIANIEIQRGQLDAARERLTEALALRRQIADQAGQASCQVGLGAVAYAEGDRDGALAAWRAGLELAELAGDRDTTGAFLNNIGEVLVETGDLDHAEATLREAQEVTEEIGDQRTLADVRRNQAALAALRGDFVAALAAVDSAAEICNAIGSRPTLGQVLRTRGSVLSRAAAAGAVDATPEAARACFEEASAVFAEVGNAVELKWTRAAYARHLRRHGDGAAADALLALSE